MASTLIAAGTTTTTRLDMVGTDDLTVQNTGALSVSANNQAVRFNGATTGALITNSGTIENTAGAGRAIRIETSVGATFTATITNNATGIIQSNDDAIQIQAGAVTGGTLTITNAGTISSTANQALDLAGGTGGAIQNVTNSGQVNAAANDAIRFGGVAALINSSIINGGTAAAYSVGTDGVNFEGTSSGTVTNNFGGAISGDRHAIDGAVGTVVTVTNNAGATLTGRNGSGVGLDGSGTVFNFGTITGAFANIAGSDVNGTTVGLANGGGPDGILDGDGDGIDIDGQATVRNHGLIEGTGAGGSGSDGRLNTSEAIAAGGGSFTNFATGTIRGLGLGMLIDDSTTGPAAFQTIVWNEGVIEGTNSFAIRIIGTQDDRITNSGSISGGGGTAIQLGGGNDRLNILSGSAITGVSDGETGTDTLIYFSYGSSVSVNLSTGSATGTGGVSNFETVVGSGFADTITGGANAETILGGEGADILAGGGDNDLLDGGAGGDTMTGGEGNDTYVIDSASDSTVEILGGGTLDRVYTSVSLTGASALADNIEYGAILGASGLTLEGNAGANILVGNSAANQLIGGGGDDRLVSGGGGDTMTGGEGNDSYFISAAGDSAVEGAGVLDGSLDVVYASAAVASLGLNIEYAYLTGNANLALTGNAQGNRLIGNSGDNTLSGLASGDLLLGLDGADTLLGGDGNDRLAGGLGQDTLTGGAFTDRFVFANTAETSALAGQEDVISDFASGDRIDLGAIDANTGTGADDGFTFLGTGAFNLVDPVGQLRFQASGPDTRIEGDVNGDQVADFAILVTGSHIFAAGDFVL